MQVELVQTQGDVDAVVAMAREHPNPEYDCTFEYFTWVLGHMITTPNIRGWVLKEGGEYVGYSVGMLSQNITHQISVFDVYLKPEYRGKGNILQFVESWCQWAMQTGLKRVVWMSKRPLKVYQRYLRKDIQTYYSDGKEVFAYSSYMKEV